MASRRRRLQLLANLERKHGLPRGLLYGVWGAESGFAEHGGSRSGAGAVGPFQFMPATAQAYGVDPRNFASSAKGAARYLAQYRDRGLAGMLAAYNAGPAGDPNNPETRAYVPRVRELMAQAPYLASGGGGRAGGGGAGGGGLPRVEVGQAPVVLPLLERRRGPESQGLVASAGVPMPEAPVPEGYRPLVSAGPPEREPTPLAEAMRAVALAGQPEARVVMPRFAPGGGQAAQGGLDVPERAAPQIARALRWAAGRLGVTETVGQENRGRRIDRWQRSFGMLGQPWCGIFVGKALQRAGLRVDARIASTAQIVEMARNGDGPFRGLVSAREVRPGDVVVWNPGPQGHTGIVEQVNRDGTISVIEGNSSNSVRRRVHPTRGAFFARPRYKA